MVLTQNTASCSMDPAHSVPSLTGYHSRLGRPSGRQHLLPGAAHAFPQQVLRGPHGNRSPMELTQNTASCSMEPAHWVPSLTGYHSRLGRPSGRQHLLPGAAHAFPQQVLSAPHGNLSPLTLRQVTAACSVSWT